MKARIAMFFVSLTPALSQREREIRSAFGAYFHRNVDPSMLTAFDATGQLRTTR